MKINGPILLLLIFLLTAFWTPGSLSAQQKGSGKKEEIRVPPGVLKPAVMADHFSDNLKEFRKWLESIELPVSGAEYQRRAADFSEASEGRVRSQLTMLRSLAVHPDVEEVTRLSRTWYGQIYNAALPLQSAAEALYSLKILCVEKNYQAARRTWNETVTGVLSILDDPPKKLSKEYLETVIAQNRERRKKEYIKWYRAKQAEERKKAKEKAAASGDKKNKPKKKPARETEEE